MEVCRLEVLLQYMKRDINKLILLLLNHQWSINSNQSKSDWLSSTQSRILRVDWLILEYNEKATFSQGDWTSILRYVADPVQDWDLISMWLVVWRGLNLNWLEISARLFSLVQSFSALVLDCSFSNLVAPCSAQRLYSLHTLYYSFNCPHTCCRIVYYGVLCRWRIVGCLRILLNLIWQNSSCS